MASDALQALYRGDADEARRLLAPDQELDVFDAAAFGRLDRLRELLADEPARARAFSDDGFTALHLAVYAAQEDAARILIDAGADVDVRSTGSIAQVPPLGTAAFVRSLPLARLLLDAGADVNGHGAGGFTPLDSAYVNGDTELIRELESRGGVRGLT
jgi:uncharacterized protein